MVKYCLLQFKRLFRILPYVFSTVLILVLCLMIAFYSISASSGQDDAVRFRLALVGSANDGYLRTGLNVVQAYDSSRFAVEIVQMEEQEALEALESGEIGAYVVVPDGYIKDAMNGRIGSLRYVSTTGAADLTALFKDEITAVVSDIIVTSEQAMYGIDDALRENDLEDRINSFTYDISLTYVDYILDRTDTYSVEVLGIHDSLGLDGYLFSGISVLLITIMVIPASVVCIKKDFSFEKLLRSKGFGPISQVAGEYAAVFGLFSVIFLVLSLAVTLASSKFDPEFLRFFNVFTISNYLKLLTVIFCTTAFGYFLFQLTDDLVSGVLIQFFAGLVFCFASGCLYPVYFFPDSLRKISSVLPQAMGRSVIASCITGDSSSVQVVFLVLYGLVMLILSMLVRSIRLRRMQR